MKSDLYITNIEVIPIEVPRVGAFRLHRGETPPVSPFTIVRVHTDAGIVGYGEGNSTVLGMHVLAERNLLDSVIGRNPFDLTGIHARMDEVEMMRNERLGHWNIVRAAIDMALWDIQGKTLDVPVHALLGGAQRKWVDVVKNVGVSDPSASAQRASEIVAEGYRTIKIRVGADSRTDLLRLRAIREAVGPEIGIRVDANQAWNANAAIAAIDSFAEIGLEAVESPCKFWDIRSAAEVVSRVSVPIISDEGFWTLGDTQNVLSGRAADVLHLYLGKCGGITPSVKIAALAEAFDAHVSPGERVPLGIAEAAHLHFAASLPSLRFPCALAYDLNEDDLLVTSIPPRNGQMEVPTGAGLGIEVDEERLEYYRVQ